MTRRNEAPADRLGRGRQAHSAAGAFCLSTTIIPRKARKSQELSRLVDQAICLAEHHEAQAWEHWRLAARHRAIKRALEQLAEVRT